MSPKRLSQYRGKLDPDQVADGINAATENARALAEDAALLYDNGRYPRAASLAILSVEESGKVAILRSLALAKSGGNLKDAWRRYRSHTAKNVMGGLIDTFIRGARKLDDFIGLFEKGAEHTHLLDQLKQIGFYTDCLGDAHWSLPSDVVDKALSGQLVRTAEILAKSTEVTPKEIELWVQHLGPVWNQDPGWMRKALENWYEDMQTHGLAPEGQNEMRQFIWEGVSVERKDGPDAV